MQFCLPTNQVERALIAVSRLEVVYVIFFVLMATDSAASSASWLQSKRTIEVGLHFFA
jgi:hypothetical protein